MSEPATAPTPAPAPAPTLAPDAPVVILNQYYVPDVASTGHLLHELARELVTQGCTVEAVAAWPSYGPPDTWQPCPLREVRDGVQVQRMKTTRFSKDRLLGRVVNFTTFIVPLALRKLFNSRRDRVYLYTTNPPFLGVIGALVSLVRRHTYVQLLHDAYPDLAVWVGTIRKSGFAERLWHWMNKMMYSRAAETIVLCEAAKELVCRNYAIDPARVHVISNWADGDLIVPKDKRTTNFSRTHGLVEPFTVLYSGNLGLYYEFETLIGAAERLKDENVKFVFVGSGGRKAWIAEQIQKRKLTNAILLPYQPTPEVPDSLPSCDTSVVSIARGIEGISYPSKLYTSLAVGKSVLALSEPKSELRELVEKHKLGRWVNIGDVDACVATIRDMMAHPEEVAAEGRRARELFDREFTRPLAAKKYAHVLALAAQRAGLPVRSVP
ncbi:MAG: glycosyltransferase family 4 protein [Phycisphaerae bacterium]|nr:glycosyltransferase family 4 protein [Phycisphaerae bacterium]